MTSQVAAALALSAGAFAWALALLLLASRRESRAARALARVLATEGALQVAAVVPALVDATGWRIAARAIDVVFLTALVAMAPAYLLLLRELPTPLARVWQGPRRGAALRVAYAAVIATASVGALAVPAVVFTAGAIGVAGVSFYALACAFDARRRAPAGSAMRQRARAFLLAFGARDGVLLLAAASGLAGSGGVAAILAALATLVYVPLLAFAIVRADLFLLGRAAPVARPDLPARFGKLERLGRGATWLAQDAAGGTRVVLKRVTSADAPACVAGRTGEARLARLVAIEPADEGAWAAFAYVEGETLREAVRRGPFDELRARRLAEDLCTALRALQEHDIVHGDVTPANIVLDAEGRATLVDLGTARAGTGSSLGTPRYLAPEQALEIASDGRADLYCVGLCVWEALAGAPYLAADGDAMDLRVRAAYPGPYRSAPRASVTFDAWLRAMLAESPDARPPSASAALAALQRS